MEETPEEQRPGIETVSDLDTKLIKDTMRLEKSFFLSLVPAQFIHHVHDCPWDARKSPGDLRTLFRVCATVVTPGFNFLFFLDKCYYYVATDKASSTQYTKAISKANRSEGKCSYARPTCAGGVGLRDLSGLPGNFRGPG
jgi:hypothetical protein